MSTSLIGVDDRSRHALEQKLASWWCATLGVQKIGIDDDFFALGCDPERGAIVLARVRQELNVEIPSSDLFEARTISKLADMIEIRQSSMDAVSIIPIRRGGRKTPLFLVHGVGGNVLGFANLVRSLDPEQPVYGIQAQALQSDAPMLIQLEAMAAYYIRELRSIQPSGPYAFLGLSFGGLVAYEMAQQLVANGESVSLVGMLDTWQPGYMRQIQPSRPLLVRMIDRTRLIGLNTSKLSWRQTVRYAVGRLKGRALRVFYSKMADSGRVSLPKSMRRVRDINLMAGARYVVRPYPGTVTLFRAFDGDHSTLPADLGWRAHALGGVEIIKLPGDHGQVLAEPNVSHLARELTVCLSQTRETLRPAAARADFALTEDVALVEDAVAIADSDTRDPTGPEAPVSPEPRMKVWPAATSRILVDHMTAIPEPHPGLLRSSSRNSAAEATK